MLATSQRLRTYTLFANLSPDTLNVIAARLSKRVFGKGVYIYHRGSPGHVLYFVESGQVRGFITSEAGREVTLAFYNPGDMFGLSGALDDHPRLTTAIAVEPTTVLMLQRDDLTQFSASQPQLAQNLLAEMALSLRNITDYTYALAFLDLTGRVATVLLQIDSHNAEGKVPMNLTQTDLANWVAASRGRVNRVLKDLRELGLIQIDEQKVIIRDRAGLERLVQG